MNLIYFLKKRIKLIYKQRNTSKAYNKGLFHHFKHKHYFNTEEYTDMVESYSKRDDIE